MLSWQVLRQLSDDELQFYDVLFVNFACAEGVPGVPSMDEWECEKRVQEIVSAVKRWTEERLFLFETEPERFGHCWDRYRMACLVAVLQWKFNMLRDPEWTFENGKDTARNTPPNHHLFAQHLMKGGFGSCASLPIVFCAVGRRLGYPLKLVRTKSHLFLRWDDRKTGNRFNIECTSHGFDTPADDYYRTWPEETWEEEIARHGYLRSMTPREELAAFLDQRLYCLCRAGAEIGSMPVRSGPAVPLGQGPIAGDLPASEAAGTIAMTELMAVFAEITLSPSEMVVNENGSREIRQW